MTLYNRNVYNVYLHSDVHQDMQVDIKNDDYLLRTHDEDISTL